jgi:protein kinase A
MSALVASIKSHIPDSKVLKSSQADKDYVAQFSNIGDQNRVMSPQEIADKSPNEKKLGKSSKTLSLSDFELVKTLGTGTFARVWMVKLANPKEEDREKVFALKVLRKSEGEFLVYLLKKKPF